MLRSTASKIAWIGRTASMVFGLALVLALIFGVATTALSATGGNFLLGKPNEAGSQTTLVGTVTKAAQSALVVVNKGTGSALDLRVTNTNSPPMKVNSTAEVANLNAQFAGHADTADSATNATSADNAATLEGKTASDFAASLHDHDSRYYTETEVYNKAEVNAALSGKANTTHQHSGGDITTGTVLEPRIDGAVARDAEVPQIVRNNDGQGSGLDADVLDGRDSSTYLPGNLPSGSTIRGTFAELDVAPSTSHGQYVAISFGYSVSPAPTPHYVVAGAPTPTGCTGSAANPGAQPGHLCIFELSSSNVAFRNVFIVESSGAVVALGPTTTNTYYAYGTWAVSAP